MLLWRIMRGRHLGAAVAAATLIFMVGETWAAKTVYVDGVNGNDAWDGLCEEWDGGTCGPKKTIQAGITVAVDNDEVIVADAVYSGAGNRKVQFYGKKIIVASKNGPADCIVDCLNGGDPAFHFESGEGADSILDGFIVKKCNGC